MKNILLIFCFVFSVSNYGQYAKKDLSVNGHSEYSVSEIDDLFFEKAVVYPNLTRGLLNIKNAVLDKVSVYDAWGQLQKAVVILNDNEHHTIDLFQLPKGTYFIVLEKDNKTARRKFIIN
jgi:hypothetical protein